MLALIAIAFAAALAAPWLYRLLRGYTAFGLALVPFGGALWLLSHLPLKASPAATATEKLPWIPALGIDLAFHLDGLSAIFGLLITGIGTLILIYAGGYMRGDPRLGRLLGLLLLFMGAMLGVVFSDDLFLLFIFWELTSISSYLLIGFKHEKQDSRDSARQALLVTGAGGLALFAGLILLSLMATQGGMPLSEATKISNLLEANLTAHPIFPAALFLILLGAFTKSAQVPFHFWLPNAMTAPTPVSAYLHSATMVKAGVYLLARLQPAFGDTTMWHVCLTTAGAATMLTAAVMAAGQSDLKRILAYTTVSVLGTLVMLIGVGTDLAIKAAVVYLVAHASYKAALFMIAGSLEHETGTRDATALGGLFRTMPLTAIAGLIAALSMAGAPPLFGFIGKELLLKAKLNLESLGVVLIVVASLANIFLIAMALVVAVWPFFGPKKQTPQEPHEAPWPMLVGPLLLAGAGLFVGVIPDAFDKALGSAIASAIAGGVIEMKLKLWHGLNPVALTAMAISAVTLVAGFVLFVRLHAWFEHFGTVVTQAGRIGPARLYQFLFDNLFVVAERITHLIQTGSLRRYVLVVLLTMLAVISYPLALSFGHGLETGPGLLKTQILLFSLTVVGVFGAAFSKSRLAAIALIGLTGVIIAIAFALYSAPDLAMTQIMVETLTVILLVLIFYRLGPFSELRNRAEQLRDGLVALAGGAVMASLVLSAASIDLPTTLSDQAAQTAKPEAYGRNVVNVILVDFRALDTLGEITVVAVAALGVYALMKLRPRSRPTEGTA